MAGINKCSLNNMLQSILSVGNEEQSAIYPPSIYSNHYNIVTSFVISKLVKSYPDSPLALDILDPFIKFSMCPVKKGTFNFPDDYRDILGAPYVFVNGNKDGECGKIPQITTSQQFLTAQLKGGCNATAITIVSESEFAIRTNSTYKKPTHANPIGYLAGQKTVKICPYDLTSIALLYVRQEKIYQYGYVPQPDDTYIFDPSTTVESEWTTPAFELLFKGMMALFSVYVKDQEITNWSALLNERGIL